MFYIIIMIIRLVRLYYVLMGARIGSNVKIHKDANLGQADLLDIGIYLYDIYIYIYIYAYKYDMYLHIYIYIYMNTYIYIFK
jgi:hypothetical protein